MKPGSWIKSKDGSSLVENEKDEAMAGRKKLVNSNSENETEQKNKSKKSKEN